MENAELDVYIEVLVDNGLFVVDENGVGSLNTPVLDVINALHEVLAGGAVTITVDTEGSSNIKATLEEKLVYVVESLNVPQQGGGTVFTP